MYFSAGGNFSNSYHMQQYYSTPAIDGQNWQQYLMQEQEPTFTQNLHLFHQYPQQNQNSYFKASPFKQGKGKYQGCQAYYYQAHTACSVESYSFTEYSCSESNLKNITKNGQLQHKIGCRQYFVNVTFNNPTSQMKLYQSQKKMLQYDNSLSFSVQHHKSQNFQPNIILIPLRQFNISVKILQIQTNKENYRYEVKMRVDLNNKKEGTHYVKTREGSIVFMAQFQIVEDQKSKMEIINKMNFKYKGIHHEFILFNKFSILFDQDDMSPTSIQNLSREEVRSSNDFVFQDIEVLSPNEQAISQTMSQPQLHHPSNETQGEQQFISYVKTQAGSKQFQKKVKGLKSQQIQIIINQILCHLEQIILNDYANYMFQSLIAACNFEQRMRIILKVGDILAKLVCQQQGTFVFQQLISYLTRAEQFESICKSISKDFKLIALDNYGNHFMRKLIQNMPKQMLSFFLETIYDNFSDLAKNRNAVCVMKCVLRALKEGEIFNNQFLGNSMKRFLAILTLNTQNLINDQFGNYLIQQAYQLIESEKLGGISEYIMEYFMDYSCQKFSNNVVLNCIKKYWRKQNNVFKTLKKNLQSKHISIMYHNREGNKILLQVMELPVELGLKDKISSVIRNQSPTKYNNRRWLSITGKSKTGAVGTHYNNFSEAHSFSKKKHYS